MSRKLEEKIGQELEPYTFLVEKGKIKEMALAIGDHKEEYLNGERILPTFPTVIDFWGGGSSTSELLDLDVKKVLHGEQEYEYLGEMKPGEEITVKGCIEDIYTKAAMNFVIIKKEYFNQSGELVLRSRSTIIERQ